MSEHLRNLLDRATKTAAQAAVLAIGADAVNILTVDWSDVAGLAGGGFILSALTSVAHQGIIGNMR